MCGVYPINTICDMCYSGAMTRVAPSGWFEWLTQTEMAEVERLEAEIAEMERELRELKRQREVLSRRGYNRRYVARGRVG